MSLLGSSQERDRFRVVLLRAFNGLLLHVVIVVCVLRAGLGIALEGLSAQQVRLEVFLQTYVSAGMTVSNGLTYVFSQPQEEMQVPLAKLHLARRVTTLMKPLYSPPFSLNWQGQTHDAAQLAT